MSEMCMCIRCSSERNRLRAELAAAVKWRNTPDEVEARVKEAEAKIAVGCLISNAAEVVDLVAQARRDALEEAARECEGNFDSEMRVYGDHFAASIRALKGEGDE